jgi:hypothetical protein
MRGRRRSPSPPVGLETNVLVAGVDAEPPAENEQTAFRTTASILLPRCYSTSLTLKPCLGPPVKQKRP